MRNENTQGNGICHSYVTAVTGNTVKRRQYYVFITGPYWPLNEVSVSDKEPFLFYYFFKLIQRWLV
jgi:hypothetical protein